MPFSANATGDRPVGPVVVGPKLGGEFGEAVGPLAGALVVGWPVAGLAVGPLDPGAAVGELVVGAVDGDALVGELEGDGVLGALVVGEPVGPFVPAHRKVMRA